MAEKPEDMTARLAQLHDERASLDAAIEDMIISMAQVPEEERASGPWSRDGASTRKYLELTSRQAEVEAEIIALGRAIAASGDEQAPSLH
jgi:hypothetical protein